jgi:cbb3-type cytochrome oxidase subunit 3
MKRTTHLHFGEAATTIGLALVFLGLVMFLSYVFINANS